MSSLKAIALAHPSISITLRNEITGEVEFQSFVSQTIKDAFCHLFRENRDLVSFHDVRSSWRVHGFFGKGHHDKSKQFIYVNHRWVKRSKLTQKIAEIFKNLQRGHHELSESPRKAKYPVFLVFFECPLNEVEMTLEPRKTLIEFEHPEEVHDFIQKAVTKSFKVHQNQSPSQSQTKTPKRSTVQDVTGIFEFSQGVKTTPKTKVDRLKAAYDMGGTRKGSTVSKNVILNKTGPKHFVDDRGIFRKSLISTNTSQRANMTSTMTSTIRAYRSQLDKKLSFPPASGNQTDSPEEVPNKTTDNSHHSSFRDSLPDSSCSEDAKASEADVNFREGMDAAREHILKLYETDQVVWGDEGSNSSNFAPSFESHFTEPPTDMSTSDFENPDQAVESPKDATQSKLDEAKSTFTKDNGKSAKRMLLFEPERAVDSTTNCSNFSFGQAFGSDKNGAKRRRPWPLPSGTSPYMKGNKVKLRSEIPAATNFELSEQWDNPNYQSTFVNPQENRGSWRNNPFFQKSLRFDKSDLHSAEPLCQIDDKYIAALMNDMLVLFDQHAVHERIRLERLMAEHFRDSREVLKAEPSTPVPLYLPPQERHVLQEYLDRVQRFGLSLDMVGSECLMAKEVPVCFLQRQASEQYFKRPSQLQSLVKELAQELVGTLVETKGAICSLPVTILNVINSQACRGTYVAKNDMTIRNHLI